MKQLLDSAGLRAVSAHEPIETLETEVDRLCAYYGRLGVYDLVCPFMPEPRRKTANDWRSAAESLNEVGMQFERRGFRLHYHNHNFELDPFDGGTGLELLFENSDPKYLLAELDTYWIAKCNVDPVSIIKRLSGRLTLLHLKDMAQGPDQTFAEIGAGVLNWAAILAAAEASGVQWYIVEQDTCAGPPLESIRLSLSNLHKIGLE